jgi:hypothetical protein
LDAARPNLAAVAITMYVRLSSLTHQLETPTVTKLGAEVVGEQYMPLGSSNVASD